MLLFVFRQKIKILFVSPYTTDLEKKPLPKNIISIIIQDSVSKYFVNQKNVQCSYPVLSFLNEPCHEKTNILVSDPV